MRNSFPSSPPSRPSPHLSISAAAAIVAVFFPSVCESATIAHRYSFNAPDDTTDSVGGNDGILLNGASVDPAQGGLVLPGTGQSLDAANMGFDDFIDLGLTFGDTGVSIETWYTDEGSGTWAKLFMFGTNQAGLELAWTNFRGGGDLAPGIDRNGAHALDSFAFGSNSRVTLNEEHHLVVTVESDGTTNLWLDGTREITDLPTNDLINITGDVESIGATSWNDPGHFGSVSEFRIWEGGLTAGEVGANLLVGPDALPGPEGDIDDDGLLDVWEIQWFGDLSQGPDDNPDDDGLTNLREFEANPMLDPTKADSDEDGLDDGPEVDTHRTNPLVADSDSDTLNDGDEVNMHKTNPLDPDSDFDFYADGVEIANGTDPLDPLDPGPIDQPELAHRYSFNEDASDLVGGVNGFLVGDAFVDGGDLLLDGDGDWMEFESTIGIGENFGSTGVTIESWYTDDGSGTWAKLFSFGNPSAGQELAYTHVRADGQTSAVDRNGAHQFGFDIEAGEKHHIAVSVEPDGTLNTWLDGENVNFEIATNPVSNITSTTEFIGESAWRADPEHFGAVHEFRIWRGALNEDQVLANIDAGEDGVGGGSAPLEIIGFTYSAGVAAVTWRSVNNRIYAIDIAEEPSSDPDKGWVEENDGIIADSDTTTFEETPPPGTKTRYYRVRDVTP